MNIHTRYKIGERVWFTGRTEPKAFVIHDVQTYSYLEDNANQAITIVEYKGLIGGWRKEAERFPSLQSLMDSMKHVK